MHASRRRVSSEVGKWVVRDEKNWRSFWCWTRFFLWKVGIFFVHKNQHPKTRCSFTPKFCPRSESEKYATTSKHLKSWRKQGKKTIKSSCRQLNKMFGWYHFSMGISTLTYPVHLGPRKIPSQKVAYVCCLSNTLPETNSWSLNIGHPKLFFQPSIFVSGRVYSKDSWHS